VAPGVEIIASGVERTAPAAAASPLIIVVAIVARSRPRRVVVVVTLLLRGRNQRPEAASRHANASRSLTSSSVTSSFSLLPQPPVLHQQSATDQSPPVRGLDATDDKRGSCRTRL